MSCAEFLRRLQLLLDERRAPRADADISRHADQCDDCRERLAAQEQLFLLLSAAVSGPFPGESKAGSQVRRAKEPVSSSSSSRRGVGWELAMSGLVASVALLGLVILFWPAPTERVSVRKPGAGPLIQVAGAPGAPVATQGESRERPWLAGQEGAADVSSVVTTSSDLAAGSPMQAIPVAMVPALPEAATPSLAERLSLGNLGIAVETSRISQYLETMCKSPPIPEQSVPQVGQLTEEVMPLAQPFLSVFDVLIRTLPISRPAAIQPSGGEAFRGVGTGRWV